MSYLDEQEQIRILALGRSALALLDVVVFDVDALRSRGKMSINNADIERNHGLTILLLLLRRFALSGRRRTTTGGGGG